MFSGGFLLYKDHCYNTKRTTNAELFFNISMIIFANIRISIDYKVFILLNVTVHFSALPIA